MLTVTLQQANQQFSKLVASVERGETIVITRRGKPIARLVPETADRSKDPAWKAAYERMMTRLERGASLGGLRVLRDELYDR